MTRRTARIYIFLLFVSSALTACGLRGDLYLETTAEDTSTDSEMTEPSVDPAVIDQAEEYIDVPALINSESEVEANPETDSADTDPTRKNSAPATNEAAPSP